MDLYKFNELSFDQKAITVKREGYHVADRFQNNNDYMLYMVGDFYAQLEFCNEEEDINRITSFRSGKLLDIYLQEIDISDLNGV